MGSKGGYCGRSDYGPGKGKGNFVSDQQKGDKGVPPGQKTQGKISVTKGGVVTEYDAGDKGIPPFGKNPTAKPALD